MKNLMETLRFDEEGFEPLMEFEDWSVAILNTVDVLQKENISYMEKHLLTDEVFVLLEGQADLFLAEGEHEITKVYRTPMEIGAVYQVKKDAWHTVAMKDNTKILLVEKKGTGEENTPRILVTQDMLNNAVCQGSTIVQ